jgi:hypothetical protein
MFQTLRKRRVCDAIERRRRLRARRQRDFRRSQSRQRMMFVFLLSMAALTIQSPVRSVWMKHRSNSWWEDVVNATFTSDDWLENLRMSKATFLYVCDELRSSVEKNDTSMRKAIPVEQRVALTLVFVNRCGFSYDWSPIWCVQVSCVCDNLASLQCFGCNIATKVRTIPQ